jgi:hypothetical protein
MHISGPLHRAPVVFRRRVRRRSLQPPLAVAATSPFPSIRLLASCWASLSENDTKQLGAFHGVPRQPQRPQAASALRLPPVPSQGLSRRRCGRSRTQPVTLRIGIALLTERCAPPTARPPAARQHSRDACSCPCHAAHGTPFQAREVRLSSPNSRVSATGRHLSSLI